MLDPFSRGAIVALLALCVAGTIAFAEPAARGLAQDLPEHHPSLGIESDSDGVAVLPIRRDPFADVPARQAALATAIAPSMHRGELGPLPSNLQSDVIPTMPGAPSEAGVSAAVESPAESSGTSVRITAIVTGAHPYALIETGGVHEIKGIGDRVHGDPITAIDIDGIRLRTGEHLAVDPADRP